jgi:N-acetylmuramoyl-L-alanine amidase
VPGVEVILTRRSDEFVPLQERTAIANREGADLFLSIHANASANSSAQGVETYFLNFATSGAAAAVAARENAASGQPMAALPDLVKAIALHNKMDESRDLAVHVQSGLTRKLQPANRNLKNLGVKQAPFVVLIGASMPSVLAEISFLTNPRDLSMVRTSSYRQRIAEGLFDAIRRYQTSLKTDTKATQQ